MSDVAATQLVRAASRFPAFRRISATRLIVFGVVAVELAWLAGLSALVYEVLA